MSGIGVVEKAISILPFEFSTVDVQNAVKGEISNDQIISALSELKIRRGKIVKVREVNVAGKKCSVFRRTADLNNAPEIIIPEWVKVWGKLGIQIEKGLRHEHK